jgi:hypothetical protein
MRGEEGKMAEVRTRKIKGHVVKYQIVPSTPDMRDSFAFCEECGWKGKGDEVGSVNGRDACPQCQSKKISIFDICPECGSPDYRESQAAYLVDIERWPCEECLGKIGIVADHTIE